MSLGRKTASTNVGPWLVVIAAGMLAACSLVADLSRFDGVVPASNDGGASSGSSSSLASVVALSKPDAEAPIDGAPAAIDAGVGSADAGGDATSETAISDAGDLADLADLGDAAALSWCARHASDQNFDCHDFDECGDAGAGFTSHFYSGDYASVTSSDYAPGSPPSSLVVSTPALDAGNADDQYNDVLLYKDKLELEFSVKIVNQDLKAGDLSLFRLSYQNNAWALTFDMHGASGALDEQWSLPHGGTGQASHAVEGSLALSAWTDIDIVVDFALHTVSMTVNGAEAVKGASISNPSQSNPALFVQTVLNYLSAPATPMLIYYDDIVVRTPP
jgi:hypothetical protein